MKQKYWIGTYDNGQDRYYLDCREDHQLSSMRNMACAGKYPPTLFTGKGREKLLKSMEMNEVRDITMVCDGKDMERSVAMEDLEWREVTLEGSI